jgi:two-component system OmpR family sensor kinase
MYLDEIVDEVASGARILAATRDVAVEFNGSRSASFVGDEELIRRMVTNLLDNAVRHSPSGSVVNVSLRTVDSGYLILVADQGPGIPPENQPHIFERFYRADASRGSRDGGAGLGLALVRWVAHLHGGKVTLTTSSKAGSTFTVELPSAG